MKFSSFSFKCSLSRKLKEYLIVFSFLMQFLYKIYFLQYVIFSVGKITYFFTSAVPNNKKESKKMKRVRKKYNKERECVGESI